MIILFYLVLLGTGISPFGRYPSTFGAPNPNFPSLSTFPPREMPPLGGLGAVHDPWRGYVNYSIITASLFIINVKRLCLICLTNNVFKSMRIILGYNVPLPDFHQLLFRGV